jgi:signal transduction histidine kinase
LAATLQARLEAVEQRAGLTTELTVAGVLQLAPETEAGLCRIAQEALNNALKHAGADRVSVALEQCNGVVRLEIADDGHGFDSRAAREGGGFGLCSMEERVARMGGKLAIESLQGEGTRICVEVKA